MTSMREQAGRAAERVLSSKRVLVVTHIDADGICAAALASSLLDRAKIKHEVTFLKKLDSAAIETIKTQKPETVWFTDFGSGAIPELSGLNAVIADHHVPAPSNPSAAARRDLVALAEALDGSDIPHVNPHLEGRDGGTDLSGAGATYLIGKEMTKSSAELAHIAVVGAVGDLQDREGGLAGTNRAILEEARKAGVIEVVKDISFFGRETRPLHKFLQYASEPRLPGISGDEDACIRFLIDAGVRLKEGESWRRWIDLSRGERASLSSRLKGLLEDNGIKAELEREVYVLPRETPGTPVHEAKEFATMLNSCGRYGKGDVALRIAKGDRRESYYAGLDLQDGHRRNLVDFLQVVRDIGVQRRGLLQYFNADDMIAETVLGTVAGMALNSGLADCGIPIFAFARADDGVKVSARGTRLLVEKGLDLSELMRLASEKVGGKGGGHRVAAGATIPPGTEEAFLGAAEVILKKQMGG
ncbi:MAG: DHH family phosphoesterase [Euryarchaeota archaeon]|nr:DHH family phosphoesterase [Euryarchaeota archaeon]